MIVNNPKGIAPCGCRDHPGSPDGNRDDGSSHRLQAEEGDRPFSPLLEETLGAINVLLRQQHPRVSAFDHRATDAILNTQAIGELMASQNLARAHRTEFALGHEDPAGNSDVKRR